METLQTEYEAQGQELSNTIESKKDEVANLDAQIQAAQRRRPERLQNVRQQKKRPIMAGTMERMAAQQRTAEMAELPPTMAAAPQTTAAEIPALPVLPAAEM